MKEVHVFFSRTPTSIDLPVSRVGDDKNEFFRIAGHLDDRNGGGYLLALRRVFCA